MKRVRVGSWYRYEPNGWDILDPRHIGLSPGQVVQVRNAPGCPKANTMGHCHVYDTDGDFIGLVDVRSLEKLK